MFYQVIRSNDYLEHSAKGTAWKNKKYINKVRTKNGKWRYIYAGQSSSGSRKRRSSDATYNAKSIAAQKAGAKASYSDYAKNDSDFDEKNYSDKNRIGDTDFFGFKKPDGSFVLLEEDMKWTVPAGSDVDQEALERRINKVNDYFDELNASGKNHTHQQWRKLIDKAINGAIVEGSSTSKETQEAKVEEKRNKGKSSKSSQESKVEEKRSKGKSSKSSDEEIEDLALEVIRGNYGNGEDRKKRLRSKYKKVQAKVNAMLNNA